MGNTSLDIVFEKFLTIIKMVVMIVMGIVLWLWEKAKGWGFWGVVFFIWLMYAWFKLMGLCEKVNNIEHKIDEVIDKLQDEYED
jgi:hypothetical protein